MRRILFSPRIRIFLLIFILPEYASSQQVEFNKSDDFVTSANSTEISLLDREASVDLLRRVISNVTGLISNIFENYSRRIPPNYPDPVEVRIGLYIKDFYDVSEESMDFSMNYYLRLNWEDQKLSFDAMDDRDHIMLDPLDITERLWIPDVYLRNEKGTNSLNFWGISDSNTLARVNASGSIWYVRELTTKFRCSMDLHHYPMDIQECPVQFESFKYNLSAMNLAWLSIEFSETVNLASFSLLKLKFRNCSEKYTSGQFPCQEVRFVLQRKLGYFFIQVYMPSMLTVMLSWLAFWIDMDTGSQVDLALILVLTMITISTSVQQSLPRVSYIKAIDVWAFSCLFFVCASLMEIAIVNAIVKKEKRKKELEIKKSDGDTDKMDSKIISKEERMRRCSRVVFPLAFSLFNVIYWWWYLSKFTEDFAPSSKLGRM